MFKSTKREIERIVAREIIDRFNSHNTFYHDNQQKYVCEICGCLILPEFAVAGEKEIRNRTTYCAWGNLKEDYIHIPYYCKVHLPRMKK